MDAFIIYFILLTYAEKQNLSISFLKLSRGYMFWNSWKEPVYHHLTYCTFIPQWSDQYSNMPHRSCTILWSSLRLSVWSLFNEGLLTLFFVTPSLPSIFLHWRWLTFHLFKHAWISLKRFFFRNLTIVYTIFSHPVLETWLWHPGSGSLLYIQDQASKLKDIAQQSLTHFYIFSIN